KLVELPLVAVLKCRRYASLRRPGVNAAADNTRTKWNFEATMERKLHRKGSLLIDDRLVGLRKVIHSNTKPCRPGEQQSTHRQVEERFSEIGPELFGGCRVDKVSGVGVELIPEC